MKEPFLIHFMKLILTLLPRLGKDNIKKKSTDQYPSKV